jgi:alkanesulfonate monooxygenase SsuD/methylene tetrahydromethanopterin reductase-like flavin-dependent oxidoreductase (luciferase family)
MIGVNVVAAPTDAEARHLFTSAQQQFTHLLRGTRGLLRPPIPDIEAYWSAPEKAQASRMLARSLVGSPDTIARGLADLVAETGADELMVASAIHDPAARHRSYAILAEVRDGLERRPARVA